MANRKKTIDNKQQIREIIVSGTIQDASIVINGDSNSVYTGITMPMSTPLSQQETNVSAFRVLTIVARALDEAELPEIADAWSLADGLSAVQAPVEISFLRPPMRGRLELVLDDKWDVLHFDGHGTAQAGGFLVFETEDGLSHLVSTDEFIAVLQRAAQLPKLVILSACQSAKGDDDGLAGRLVRDAGLPAVIGFSETVPVDLTMAFVGRLYAALGAGRTIADSFNSARESLSTFRDVTLPPENKGDRSRTIPAINFPVLTGSNTNQPLCSSGLHGLATIDREPLFGVPAPSESGRFYGVFEDGDPPTGRKGLLVRAARALLNGEKMLILSGQGGIGKTALAAALARRLAWRFPGGVFWVNGSDYIDSILRLDDALDVFEPVCDTNFLKGSTAQKRQAVLAYLEQVEKPSLWIIDNADVAEEKVWQMARQVPGRNAVLLTTREKPEYGGRPIEIEGMVLDEALPFLVNEVRRRKGNPMWGVRLDQTELYQLLEIARLLDGHALALLLAAPLIAGASIKFARNSVKANPARGETEKRFDFSYMRLKSNEVALLHRLSAFAADFDAKAIESVCTFIREGEPESELLPNWEYDLLELTRKSFVEFKGEDDRRYRLHPVLREYIQAKAKVSLIQDQRHIALYYLQRAHLARTVLPNAGGDTFMAVEFAARERINLLKAQEVFLIYDQNETAIVAECLDDLFERIGYWEARRTVLQNALLVSEKLGGRKHAVLLHRAGVFAQQTGEYTEARQLLESSFEVMQALEDKKGMAYTMGALGNLAIRQANYKDAKKFYYCTLKISRELKDQYGIGRTLHQLGMVKQAAGPSQYRRARGLYHKSLTIKRLESVKDKEGEASSLHHLGQLAHLQGDYKEARDKYIEAGNIFKSLSMKLEQADTIHQLGVLAEDEGDLGNALILVTEAEKMFFALGSPNVKTATKNRERIKQAIQKKNSN